MEEITKCKQCGADIVWDKVHRVEIELNQEISLCDDCCPNCFTQLPTTSIP